MEAVEDGKCTLEQQVRVIAVELAIEKASSSQAGKDKNVLESSFEEHLSHAAKEIRSLKLKLPKPRRRLKSLGKVKFFS